jgi:hypothetical protein
MKKTKTLLVLGFVACAFVMYVQASTNSKSKSGGYVTATVVSVEKHQEPSNFLDNPTDAPLHAEDYSYEIGLRVDCDIYVGLYDPPTDYLPTAFARDHAVDVRLQKHVMYVSLPTNDRDIKMGIVSHRHVKEGCPAKG